jgi:hypothetical protein
MKEAALDVFNNGGMKDLAWLKVALKQLRVLCPEAVVCKGIRKCS